jgi:hypothetical protein
LAAAPLLASPNRPSLPQPPGASLLDSRLGSRLGALALVLLGLLTVPPGIAFGLAFLLLALSASSASWRRVPVEESPPPSSASVLPWSLLWLLLAALAASYPWARGGGLGRLAAELVGAWPTPVLAGGVGVSLCVWYWQGRVEATKSSSGPNSGSDPGYRRRPYRAWVAVAAAALVLLPLWGHLLWHPAEVILGWPPTTLSQDRRGWSQAIDAADYPRRIELIASLASSETLPAGTIVGRMRFRGVSGQESEQLLRAGVELGRWRPEPNPNAPSQFPAWQWLNNGADQGFTARYRVTGAQVPPGVGGYVQIALQPRLRVPVEMTVERLVLVPSALGGP